MPCGWVRRVGAFGCGDLDAYLRASNAEAYDYFGYGLALSGDGNTLAVGAYGEDSSALGVGNNQADNSRQLAGATYVFARDVQGTWSSNTGASDEFGFDVALSADGRTLAVSVDREDGGLSGGVGSGAPVTNGGAVYVFTRDEQDAWSQQAYVKASNPGASDYLGRSVAISEDGSTIAVGAHQEDSNAVGIGGNQADNSISAAGAVYVY